MSSRKPFGVVGATVLGIMALLGTNAVNAALNLDTDMGGVTYAKETLTGTGSVTVAGETYYMVSGADNILDVTAAIGFGGTENSTLVIKYTFGGMVLTGSSNPTLSVPGSLGANDVITRGGGQEGDSHVSFLVTRGGNSQVNGGLSATTIATLALANIAVSANAGGSVTMASTDTLPLAEGNTASYAGAVRVANALKETTDPKSPTAIVEAGFLKYLGGDNTDDTQLKSTVGSFMIALASTDHRRANDGVAITELTDLIMPAAADSSVVFSGDFSFAKAAWLSPAVDCSMPGTMDLIKRDAETGEATGERELEAQRPNQIIGDANASPPITAAPYLCIDVYNSEAEDESEKATVIPETDNYEVTTSYVAGTTGAVFPPSGGTFSLGRIERNGTTVQLPYLTTFGPYNQRIVIVNRGGEASYSFSFTEEEDGTMATAGADAKGTLAAKATTYLSLRHSDLVTLEGTRPDGKDHQKRIAATLIVESEPRNIDVVVSQTNDNGGTDTVLYPHD